MENGEPFCTVAGNVDIQPLRKTVCSVLKKLTLELPCARPTRNFLSPLMLIDRLWCFLSLILFPPISLGQNNTVADREMRSRGIRPPDFSLICCPIISGCFFLAGHYYWSPLWSPSHDVLEEGAGGVGPQGPWSPVLADSRLFCEHHRRSSSQTQAERKQVKNFTFFPSKMWAKILRIMHGETWSSVSSFPKPFTSVNSSKISCCAFSYIVRGRQIFPQHHVWVSQRLLRVETWSGRSNVLSALRRHPRSYTGVRDTEVWPKKLLEALFSWWCHNITEKKHNTVLQILTTTIA